MLQIQQFSGRRVGWVRERQHGVVHPALNDHLIDRIEVTGGEDQVDLVPGCWNVEAADLGEWDVDIDVDPVDPLILLRPLKNYK